MRKAVIRQSRGDRIFDAMLYLAAFLVLAVVLVPLIFVVSASFSDPDLVLRGKVLLLPKGINVVAYKMVFQNAEIWLGYRNTAFYTVFGTMVNIAMTILAAYPLSRKEMVGRKWLMLLIVFTMYFSGGLIPTYLLVKNLGLENTIWAMIVPVAISTYNLIVCKSFFENNIPQDLYESAMLDGCNNTRMLLSIVLPLSKAIIAVLVLYYAVAHWNSYFNALVYLRKRELQPLQIILRGILLMGETEQMGSNDIGMGEKLKMAEAIKYAVIVVASVPMLMLYPFVQKYFVQGVMVGAIKG